MRALTIKMTDIKKIDIKEFREKGFLQEANRLFFHPLGMALEVILDDTTGKEKLGEIWDDRDDPEGMLFQDDIVQSKDACEKADHVADLRDKIGRVRIKKYGNRIQPVFYNS